MPKTGDQLYLDGDEGTVLEAFTLIQGSGEDAETWPIYRVQVGERVLLVECYAGENTLYTLGSHGGAATIIEEATDVRIKRVGQVLSQPVEYTEALLPGGDSLLFLDGEVWREEDTVVWYGPDSTWLAGTQTSAAELRRYEIPACPAVPQLLERLDVAAGVGLFVWGAAELLLGPGWFGTAFWSLGLLGLVVCRWPAPFPFHRLLHTTGLAYSVWILTLFGQSLAPNPELWLHLWALFLLFCAWPPLLLHRRSFYVLADGATLAALWSIGLYIAGHFFWATGTEDASWLVDWRWYFYQPPWFFIWLGLLPVSLFFSWRDYARVPISREEFNTVQERVATLLESEDWLTRIGAIGDGLDDLADAFRLSPDPWVNACAGHWATLHRAGGIFNALAAAFTTTSKDELLGAHERASADCQTLADDLRKLSPGGENLRLSPALCDASSVLPSGIRDRLKWKLIFPQRAINRWGLREQD